MAQAKPTTKELEDKFEATAFRLTQERNDFLLPQVLDFVKKEKWINLRPEYQRRLVWDVQKRSLFIESLLLNVPIPQLFLYEWELGRYEVMDGQQRLNSVVDFYENGYELKGLERWKELNGFRYKQLPETLKRGLDRRRLSATVLLVESGLRDQAQRNDIRKLVFERLNTGGQQLNAQELRNCVYAGSFNEVLLDLARSRDFCEVWEIPPFEDNVDSEGVASSELAENPLYRRMIDCEIVLRFFAFRTKARIKGSVRAILDKCMEDRAGINDGASNESLKQAFNERLALARQIFGAHTFRYKADKGVWKTSQPLYDAVMVSLDRLWEHRDRLVAKRVAVAAGVAALLSDEDAFEVVVGRPNTSKAIVKRLELVEKAMADSAGI
jgi:Protein of unknown function DUF262